MWDKDYWEYQIFIFKKSRATFAIHFGGWRKFFEPLGVALFTCIVSIAALNYS